MLRKKHKVRGGVQAIDHVLRILRRVRPQSSSQDVINNSRKGVVMTFTDQSRSSGWLVRLAGSANHSVLIYRRGKDVQCVFENHGGGVILREDLSCVLKQQGKTCCFGRDQHTPISGEDNGIGPDYYPRVV